MLFRTILFVFAIISLCGCSLSSEQENLLNSQLTKYIQAHNENNTLVYAGLTHPAVVRYHTTQSDSSFIQQFRPKSDTLITYYSDPIYLETKVDGNWIERKYQVKKKSSLLKETTITIYALSDDGGTSWFFVNQDDYMNLEIPLKKRLFANSL